MNNVFEQWVQHISKYKTTSLDNFKDVEEIKLPECVINFLEGQSYVTRDFFKNLILLDITDDLKLFPETPGESPDKLIEHKRLLAVLELHKYYHGVFHEVKKEFKDRFFLDHDQAISNIVVTSKVKLRHIEITCNGLTFLKPEEKERYGSFIYTFPFTFPYFYPKSHFGYFFIEVDSSSDEPLQVSYLNLMLDLNTLFKYSGKNFFIYPVKDSLFEIRSLPIASSGFVVNSADETYKWLHEKDFVKIQDKLDDSLLQKYRKDGLFRINKIVRTDKSFKIYTSSITADYILKTYPEKYTLNPKYPIIQEYNKDIITILSHKNRNPIINIYLDNYCSESKELEDIICFDYPIDILYRVNDTFYTLDGNVLKIARDKNKEDNFVFTLNGEEKYRKYLPTKYQLFKADNPLEENEKYLNFCISYKRGEDEGPDLSVFQENGKSYVYDSGTRITTSPLQFHLIVNPKYEEIVKQRLKENGYRFDTDCHIRVPY